MRHCRLSPTGQASQRERQDKVSFIRQQPFCKGGCWKTWMPLEMSEVRRGIPWMERCGWADARGSAGCRAPRVPTFCSIHSSQQLSGSALNHICLAPAHPTLVWPGCPSRARQRHLHPSPCRGAPCTRESGATLRELARAREQPEGRGHVAAGACLQSPAPLRCSQPHPSSSHSLPQTSVSSPITHMGMKLWRSAQSSACALRAQRHLPGCAQWGIFAKGWNSSIAGTLGAGHCHWVLLLTPLMVGVGS